MNNNKAKQIIQFALEKGIISEENLLLLNCTAKTINDMRPDEALDYLTSLMELNMLTLPTIKQLEKELNRKKQTQSGRFSDNRYSYKKYVPLNSLSSDKVQKTDFDFGKTIEHYQIISILGIGGMSKVYKAYDPYLKRFVAIKFVSNNSSEAEQRLCLEGYAQAKVEHPHICKIYQLGKTLSHTFIVMQYIDGQTLDEIANKISLDEKVKILIQVAEAMEIVHKNSIIHRDIKPKNIVVQKTETGWHPYIIDFGLAQEMSSSCLTEPGIVLGTPYYMSPEQASGEREFLDGRSDVYSLGATLYELISGKPPIDGFCPVDILMNVISQDPVPLTQLDNSLPQKLEAIILKCLAKKSIERYSSAQELATELKQYLIFNKQVTLSQEVSEVVSKQAPKKRFYGRDIFGHLKLLTKTALFVALLIGMYYVGTQKQVSSANSQVEVVSAQVKDLLSTSDSIIMIIPTKKGALETDYIKLDNIKTTDAINQLEGSNSLIIPKTILKKKGNTLTSQKVLVLEYEKKAMPPPLLW